MAKPASSASTHRAMVQWQCVLDERSDSSTVSIIFRFVKQSRVKMMKQSVPALNAELQNV